MKKIVVLTLIVGILAALTIGVVMAQTDSPGDPVPGDCPYCDGSSQSRGQGEHGGGYLMEYMHAAMADALGISEEEFESRMAAGESFFDIAQSQGFDLETFFDLHQNARQTALENAFNDGLFSEEQFNWMLERFQGMGGGGMHGRGNQNGGFSGGGRPGGCPMYSDDSSPTE
ncbi:MAG: hypothetical protein ACK2T7_15135 [Anaerolineales bacterium]